MLAEVNVNQRKCQTTTPLLLHKICDLLDMDGGSPFLLACPALEACRHLQLTGYRNTWLSPFCGDCRCC